MKNKVLNDNHSPSKNFFQSDLILRNYLKNAFSTEAKKYFYPKLDSLGKEAATVMTDLSLQADKNSPELVKRDKWGETINDIRFHPAYWELMKIAVESEMFSVKWHPDMRKKFAGETQRLSFSAGFIYAMSEMGVYCPLCMTDGVARLLDLYCDEADKKRLMPHIYTDKAKDFFTGAMFLTEKSGGSDVGANLVTAKNIKGNSYHLNGEKWFCSNANADLIFALARTDANIPRNKGLSIFLVEKHLPDETKNPIDFFRLKEKMGVKSNACAEGMLTDTVGTLVGKEFEGFAIMTEMLTLSRIYTAVGALSGSRRAIIEAYQFLCSRNAFGKVAIEHALIRTKLTELSALYLANFYLLWRTITALDKADAGNEREKEILRILTPMIKKRLSENSVYIARESMELMGGIGYIEDTVVPKTFRDLMVNPIWEGTGNIMILDMLRASKKSKGLIFICEEIAKIATAKKDSWLILELEKFQSFSKKLFAMQQDEMEASAKPFYEKLTELYQLALLLANFNEGNKKWTRSAFDYLKNAYNNSNELSARQPLSVNDVKDMVGWEM
jgi:alkylation response protein AidB-like acyl-CoA dehydrogenase